MRILRRACFVVGLVPAVLALALWWIATGEPIDDRLDKFVEWGAGE